jgi:hypothetical protein
MSCSPPSWIKYKTLFHEIIPHYQRAHFIAKHLIDTPWDTLPNIMLHAPKGFPMSLLVHYILSQKYGYATRNLHHFANHDIPFVETPFYFEIDLLHPNIKSLDVVSDFIHMIISRSNVLDQRHIFVLQNIDALDEERYAFRVLLERFCKNVLFLCTTTRISSIESPLRSRFTIWTIPALTLEEIQYTMLQLERPIHSYLIHSRNLLQVLLIGDMDPSTVTQEMCSLRYPPIADFFQRKWKVEEIRKLAFQLCSHNISLSEVAYDLLQGMSSDVSHKFLLAAAEIEHLHSCSNGGRKPLYFESMLHAALAATHK